MQNLERRIEALEQKLSTVDEWLIARVIVTPFDLGNEWHAASACGINRSWDRREGETSDEFRERVFAEAKDEGIKILTINGDIDPNDPWRPEDERLASRLSAQEAQE